MHLVLRLLAGATILIAPLASAVAQSVRGRVVDDSSGAPISAAALVLLDTQGREVGSGTRSVDDGGFRINAPDIGTYRVSARRIGYAPRTSNDIKMSKGEVVTVEIRMSRAAQVVAPVRIVERARMSLRELMTSEGYELRRAQGTGRFVTTDSMDRVISKFGVNATVRELTEVGMLYPGQVSMGWTGVVRLGPNCTPHVYIDGLRMTGGARSIASPFISIADMPAAEIYGIEVYRKAEIPPASLGGPFGSEPVIDAAGRVVAGGHTMPSNTCGIIAVWTKARVRTLGGVPAADEPALRGTLVSTKHAGPLAGASVTLRTEHGTTLGATAMTDSLGKFALRIPFSGRFRLHATHPAHDRVTTKPFAADTGQTLVVELTIAEEDQVELPLTVLQKFYGATPADTAAATRTNPPRPSPRD